MKEIIALLILVGTTLNAAAAAVSRSRFNYLKGFYMKALAILFFMTVSASSLAQNADTKYYHCKERNSPWGQFRIKIEKGQTSYRLQYYLIGGEPKVWTAMASYEAAQQGLFAPTGEPNPWHVGLSEIKVNPDMVTGKNENAKFGNYFDMRYPGKTVSRICAQDEAWNWGKNQ